MSFVIANSFYGIMLTEYHVLFQALLVGKVSHGPGLDASFWILTLPSPYRHHLVEEHDEPNGRGSSSPTRDRRNVRNHKAN